MAEELGLDISGVSEFTPTLVSTPVRESQKESQKKARSRGSPEFSLFTTISKCCCGKKEVTCFKRLTIATIEKLRLQFYSLSETQQAQHILSYMIDHSQGSDVLYTIGGQKVCEVCYRIAYGIRHNRFASIKAKFNGGVVVVEHGRTGTCQTGDVTIRVISWLRNFVQKVGDQMPTSKDINLPSCLTKHDVYALAYDDLTQGGLKCCVMSTFYKIWASSFPHVKIPKEGRFSKCDVCTAIKEGRERTLNQSVRSWLGQVMDKHIKLERDEREKYAKHRRKAQNYPTKYMSIIIDGMDQNKTDIPHITSNPKAISGAYKLETHITGVRVHGHCLMMFIDCGQFHHDSNMTIEILLQVFSKLKNCLPPILYVQMDNTCKDNKNKYTLTFAAMLIELGVFRKVKFGFLPVGHTHEDIDQSFSCISRRLKHRNALTIPDLIDVIQTSYTPQPIVEELTSVCDAKSWMSEQVPSIHDHLKAHQFKFQRNESGECRLFYKEWSTDQFWLPEGGLSFLPPGNSIPLQDPMIIYPHYESEDLKKLECTIAKISAYLDKADASIWWNSWLQKAWTQVEPSIPQPLNGSWILEELKWTSSSLVVLPTQHHDNDAIDFDVSGIEMISPKTGTHIDGIGGLRTSWIGQKGVCDIESTLIVEKFHSQVKALTAELNTLAKECMRAFAAGGLLNSDNPQISKAITLCSSYHSSADQHKTRPPPAIATLWKEQVIRSESNIVDKNELATSVLGKNLVDTITEGNREPPDIYIGPSRSTVIKNRDVAKELEVEMLVAVIALNFPKVGKVLVIPPNPVLESHISIQWMDQERAPHKPRWQRCFKVTKNTGSIAMKEIVLYGFKLTAKGCLKKKSRDYLKTLLV